MEVIEEASYLVVYIRVEAEEFFSLDNTSLGVYIRVEAEESLSLDNTSLGVLAHLSGVVLVLVGLI